MNKAVTASGNPSLTPTKIADKKPIPIKRLAGWKKVSAELVTRKTGFKKVAEILKGGPGSGNHGHEGRPGQVGGSGSGGGSSKEKPSKSPRAGAGSSESSEGAKPVKAPEKKPASSNRDEKGRFVSSKIKEAQGNIKAANKTLTRSDTAGVPEGPELFKETNSLANKSIKQLNQAVSSLPTGSSKERFSRKIQNIKTKMPKLSDNNFAPKMSTTIGHLGDLAVEILRHAKETLA